MYFKTLYIEYEHNHVTILPFSARSSSINAGENWCKRLIDDVRENGEMSQPHFETTVRG